jgi:phosphate:Na+ symporter
MKGACADIRKLPDFEAWLQRFQADSYLGIIQCMTVGCVLTMAVQSSSATLGVTIALALAGAISYPSAAGLVLGENVGTTITALLASIGATTNARRAAYFHVIFNMLGVIWIFAVFFWYVRFVPWVIGVDVGREVVTNGVVTFPETTAAIAATHSIFNVTNTLVFLPFLQVFAHVLERFVPDRAHKETPHLTSLDIRMLETPVIAIEQSRVEILRMAHGCNRMMAWLGQLATQGAPDHGLVKKLFHREEVLDTVQDEVIAFMSDLLASNLPHAIIDEGRRQLRMADEYESISDHIADLLKFRLKLSSQGYHFGAQQQADLLKLHGMISEYLDLIAQAYHQRFPEVITKASSLGSEIKHQVKVLRKGHLDGLSREKTEPRVNVAYMATLTSYLRVRNDALNVAEAVAGLK